MKSYISIYWKIWLLLISGILLLKFSLDIKEDLLFNIFMAYSAPTWIAVIFINMFEGRRLSNYLKENHKLKWEEITYVRGLGIGNRNSFRSLPFVFSEDDLSDPQLKKLKENYKQIIKLMLVVFFSMPIIFIIIVT